jgi:hypothetical protein
VSETKRTPNCPVCGAAPLTLCAPGCNYIEQLNELAASTLEGLTDEERRIVTQRVTFGCDDEEQAVIDAARTWVAIEDEWTEIRGLGLPDTMRRHARIQELHIETGRAREALLAAVHALLAAPAHTKEGDTQ